MIVGVLLIDLYSEALLAELPGFDVTKPACEIGGTQAVLELLFSLETLGLIHAAAILGFCCC